MRHLLVLNGASCAGKTTAAKALVGLEPQFTWVHPDGIWSDTPSVSPETSFGRVVELTAGSDAALNVVDCQIRPLSLAAMLGSDVVTWTSVLLRCERRQREERMVGRGWPDENFGQMASWASVLERETTAMGHLILDSSAMPPELVSARVLAHLDALGWFNK